MSLTVPKVLAAAVVLLCVSNASVSLAASSPTPLYKFPPAANGAALRGSGPTAGLTADDQGVLYGTSTRGGSYKVNGFGGGVVFKLTPPAQGRPFWTQTVLHAFTGFGDGIFPGNGNLVVASGDVYGTTNGSSFYILCGRNRNLSCDTIFKLTHPAAGRINWSHLLLHRFTKPAEGTNPVGGLVMDKTGALYGTANAGGNVGCLNSFTNLQRTIGCGLVYKLTPPANGRTPWTYSIIHRFSGGADGGLPSAALLADPSGSGVLYGTASTGGGGNCSFGKANCGVVFKLTPPTGRGVKWTETVLYSFTGRTDGAAPVGALITDGFGNLYGTTSAAGDACQVITGCGTVFQLSAPPKGEIRWRFKRLHAFAGGIDGSVPMAALNFGSAGKLYGTTSRQGDNTSGCGNAIGCGTIFKLTPPSRNIPIWTETVLHRFRGEADGGNSAASLYRNPATGVLYGTASQGGNLNCQLATFLVGCGVVFSLRD